MTPRKPVPTASASRNIYPGLNVKVKGQRVTHSHLSVAGLYSHMLTDAQLSEMISFTAKTVGIFR